MTILAAFVMSLIIMISVEDAFDLDSNAMTAVDTLISGKSAACIYNVSFPANTMAYFDPQNLSGKGQIFSDRYAIENYGNTDIAIKIKNIEVTVQSRESSYVLYEEEIEDASFDVKGLNIDMVWVNEVERTQVTLDVIDGKADEEVLILRGAEYNGQGEFVRLEEGGRGIFYFTGTLRTDSEIKWEKGELTIRFDYEIITTESGENEVSVSSGQTAGRNANTVSSGQMTDRSDDTVSSGQVKKSGDTVSSGQIINSK